MGHAFVTICNQFDRFDLKLADQPLPRKQRGILTSNLILTSPQVAGNLPGEIKTSSPRYHDCRSYSVVAAFRTVHNYEEDSTVLVDKSTPPRTFRIRKITSSVRKPCRRILGVMDAKAIKQQHPNWYPRNEMKQEVFNFIEIISKQRNFFRHLKLYDAIQMSLLELFRKKVVLKIKLNQYDLHIRSYTSDYDVALSSLIYHEYDEIKINKPLVIVDAGANIGTSAIAFSVKYPDAKIYAIEMEESNYDLLVTNVENQKNIIPIKAALVGTDGVRKIFDRSTGPWGYTVTNTMQNKKETGQEVVGITLDKLMAEYSLAYINILKIDIEGAEKEIFSTGGEWLKKTDVIVCELHDRICMGCDRSFYLATKDFTDFIKYGEKVIAYR